MAHTLQDRYSNLVLAKLRKELVLKDGLVFNNDYEGSPKAGAVKIPQRDTEVTVSAYDKANGVNPSEGATSYVTATIDRDYAVNEIIDGYDAEAVPDNLIADRLDSAGYALANQIDVDGGAELRTGGTTVGIEYLTKDNIYNVFVEQDEAMNKANIPAAGRYALCTPHTLALLQNSQEFISASNLGDEVKQNGIRGQISSFYVIPWNDDTSCLAAIFGHPRFATRVNEWQTDVHLQNLDGSGKYIGASAVQGRHIYTHKVLRQAAVRCAYAPDRTVIAAAQGGTSGTTVITCTASAQQETSYAYKINPVDRVTYGTTSTAYAGSSLTSGTTAIAAYAGDIVEVVGIKASKVVAVGYIELKASMIKA